MLNVEDSNNLTVYVNWSCSLTLWLKALFTSPLALDFISNPTFLSLVRVIRIYLAQNIIIGHARNILDPLTKTGDFPVWQFSFQNAAVRHYFQWLKMR